MFGYDVENDDISAPASRWWEVIVILWLGSLAAIMIHYFFG